MILYKFPQRLPLLLVFWVVPGEENDTESLPGSTALGGTEAVEHLLAGETRQSQELVVLDHVDDGLGRQVGHGEAGGRLVGVLLEQQQGVHVVGHVEPF